MKILIVYNRYRSRIHGEEAVVDTSIRVLRESGHEVRGFFRSSEGLTRGSWRASAAAIASVSNPFSQRDLAASIAEFRPDVVHAHNVYPWISPSSLGAARVAGIPVVMTVHHYGLTCPALTHYRDGAVCTLCLHGSELNCLRHNCRGGRLESGVYALRAAIARRRGHFLTNVTTFIALNHFTRDLLIDSGVPQSQVVIRPNMVFAAAEPAPAELGSYVGYVGRLSAEKGVDVLCEAAASSGLPLKIAGEFSATPQLHSQYERTAQFLGVLEGADLERFYRQARFIVIPSRWWEVCPMVALEAMNHGTPIIASRVGGLPELIEDGASGLLVTPGNVAELSHAMQRLWHDRELRTRLAAAARKRVVERFSERTYLPEILSIYESAIARTSRVEITPPPRKALHEDWSDPAFPKKYPVLGVPITCTQYEEATDIIVEASRQGRPIIVSGLAVHGLILARNNASYREQVGSFEILAADGHPVRWLLGRVAGKLLDDRVAGTDLMERLCRKCEISGLSIYLYGSTAHVLARLRRELERSFPRLVIAGGEPSIFRPLSAEEDEALIHRINASGAAIVFLGLGCPLQEAFAHRHRGSIRAVQVCVGAAFDFLSGCKSRAPQWMQRRGLEWAHRLAQEPTRLFWRYFSTNSAFIVAALAELTRRSSRHRSRA